MNPAGQAGIPALIREIQFKSPGACIGFFPGEDAFEYQSLLFSGSPVSEVSTGLMPEIKKESEGFHGRSCFPVLKSSLYSDPPDRKDNRPCYRLR